MSANALRARLSEGGKAVGSWCVTPSAFTAEVLATEGFDYVCIDCQHGLTSLDTMWQLLVAVGRTATTAIVRVPANDAAAIGKALDAGAMGVIVPLVNTAADASRAAAACRYPPQGVRSWGPVRSAEFLPGGPQAVNREVLCFVMIETSEGLANADAICATPGVDGVYIGPADLGVSLGITPGSTSPEHDAAVEAVRLACERHGIVPGIHTSGGDDARARLGQGFRFCSLATDAVLLRAKLRDELSRARASG